MLRIPRVFMALLTGAALSVAGATFQTLLRNPLADPFTLGVAGGSSFGAVSLLLLCPAFAAVHPSALPATAFLGALLSVSLTWGLARWAPSSRGGLHSSSLLLSGLTVNFFFNALILLATYAVDFTRSASMMRWILGGLEGADREILLPALLPSMAAFFVLLALAPALALFSGGEEMARSKGVSVERTARWAFLAASLLTSSVTAFTGPIGFVGLMVPNLLRRYLGNDLKWLLPSSALLGAAFLTVADGAARTLFAPAELPVGALTALIGGPFFLFLLLRRGSVWSPE
jgi:iron complex transport system permease protein